VTLIQKAPDMVVIGQAHNGMEAVQLVEQLRPDVISMDIRMPQLGGLEATRQIMRDFPTPIVIVSNASSDAHMAMAAMQAGALAAIEKPPASTDPAFAQRCDDLVSTLRLMAGVRVIRHWNNTRPLPNTGRLLATSQPLRPTLPEIAVIGASAGGPGALAAVLGMLPADFGLPVLIVQHLTSEFMYGLAEWLNRAGPLPVRLAVEGELPMPGQVLLAPGGKHLRVSIEGRVVLDSRRGNYRHQPAVDALFQSAADFYASRALGIVLTGMGDDGAAGLRAMRDMGARTIVQNEETCVVFGMPAAAIERGAAEFVLPLEKIGSAIRALSNRGEGRTNDSDSPAR
jgi:two-component system chemotaxis response regulator CheB